MGTRLPGLIAATAFAAAVLLAPAPGAAKDMSSLYDDATLAHWQPRYRKNILWNVENVILPKLTVRERRSFAKLRFEFPLRGIGNNALSFHSTLSPSPRVVVPVLSIKNFDDMSIALAWLQLNGYTLQTAYDYIAMLKYRGARDFGGRYPPPLKALRIPDNALENSGVDGLSKKILKSALIFILLHEMGHVHFGHPGYGPGVARAQARNNEAQADQFAIDVTRRMGVAPVGIVFFFQALAHATPNRGDFSDDDAYDAHLRQATHPLTNDRLRLLAAAFRKNPGDFAKEYQDAAEGIKNVTFIANQLSQVADILADRGVQRLISEVGRKTTLSTLAPRRPDEALGLSADQNLTRGDLAPFHGVNDGEFTSQGQAIGIRVILRRKGARVAGQYSYRAGGGSLRGLIEGDMLAFEWREGGSTGRGLFRIKHGGETFSGTWGVGPSPDNGGRWTGARVRR